ncbi:MAG: HD-GYP domain-containing protein [Actinomycetota bacterium]|nr:HD-GYP domain-containing protein [Actinomycetota bacterium]
MLISAAALVGAAMLAATTAGAADWDIALLATLLAFSAVGDLLAIETARGPIKISGSFLGLVLAMVFAGGAPAAALGVATIAIGWLRWRDPAHYLLSNLAAYAWFPLLGGLVFGAVRDAAGLDPQQAEFYLLVTAVFALALALNFLTVAGYRAYVERGSLREQARRFLLPVLPSETVAVVLALGVTFLYARNGLAAIALVGFVLFSFQYLLGRLMVSEERRDELERRTTQLASLQVGLLSSLLGTLDLRDRMTARHSAAVARYSREIAAAAGFSEEDQELVHTAGLLHDIGKFAFPDHILTAAGPLSDEDWATIRTHPHEGARIVSQVEGYGPVGEIILAHHERIDGRGYPRGLAGEEIPDLSRIISVADVYDVLTARDSYREPVSSFEAIQELRRSAGSQLDPRLVAVFVELLAGRDLGYRHGEDADFHAELALEKRVHAHAARRDGPAHEQAPGHEEARGR